MPCATYYSQGKSINRASVLAAQTSVGQRARASRHWSVEMSLKRRDSPSAVGSGIFWPDENLTRLYSASSTIASSKPAWKTGRPRPRSVASSRSRYSAVIWPRTEAMVEEALYERVKFSSGQKIPLPTAEGESRLFNDISMDQCREALALWPTLV